MAIKQVRFSILQRCDKRSYAKKVATRLVEFSGLNAQERRHRGQANPFFQKDAIDVLAVLLQHGNVKHLPVISIYRLAAKADRAEFVALSQELTRLNHELREAAPLINGFANAHDGQFTGTCAEIRQALEWWASADGQNMERDAEFDFRKLVRGLLKAESPLQYTPRHNGIYIPGTRRHLRGLFDSVFITDAGVDDPAMPMYLEFVTRVIEAMKEYAQEEYEAGRPVPMTLYLVLDEIAQATLPSLPGWLADFRDRGMCVAAGGQDTQQLRDVYGLTLTEAMSKFGTTITYPGILNRDDLQSLSDLTVRQWVETHSESYSRNAQGNKEWSPSVSEQLMPALTPDQISYGYGEADVAQLWSMNRWNWVRTRPYYEGDPWLPMLVYTAFLAMEEGSDMPLPHLARYDDFSRLAEVDLDGAFKRMLQQRKDQW